MASFRQSKRTHCRTLSIGERACHIPSTGHTGRKRSIGVDRHQPAYRSEQSPVPTASLALVRPELGILGIYRIEMFASAKQSLLISLPKYCPDANKSFFFHLLGSWISVVIEVVFDKARYRIAPFPAEQRKPHRMLVPSHVASGAAGCTQPSRDAANFRGLVREAVSKPNSISK